LKWSLLLTLKQFLRRSRDSGSALECVQRAGDVFFVPRLWGHAVYNEAASVAMAIEFGPV